MEKIGIDTSFEKIWQCCLDIHNKTALSAYQGKNIIIALFNTIVSSHKQLKGIKWTVGKDGKLLTAAIVETTFENILKQNNITDIKGAVRHLDSEGFIKRQSKNRIKSKLNIDGVPCYAYQFNMDKVNEAFGTIDGIVTNRDSIPNKGAKGSEGDSEIENIEGAIMGEIFLL